MDDASIRPGQAQALKRPGAGMRQEHVSWYSPSVEREMEMLVFGHSGARVVVFPTSLGSFVEYRDRSMVGALGEHIARGWLQLYCVDSFDAESWYAAHRAPAERIQNHIRYERYILDEVLPFTRHRNPNPYVIATGCCFGAFHAMLLGLRHPEAVGRVVGLSGAYDPRRWLDGHEGLDVYFVDPISFVGGVSDPVQRDRLSKIDIVFAAGVDDPNYGTNVRLSEALASRGIPHALQSWDGWAHDWPYWKDMILDYIGGVGSR